MNINRKQVDICELIGKIADMYAFVAEEKGIGMDTNLPGDLYISIDSNRMGQAISNILDNAVKFTAPNGHIRINVDQSYKDVIIRVTDTGIGISPEELPMIWDRLYRCGQSRTEKGLGLGLSLVKGIVKAHNGHVKAVSEPGKGSTFIIKLPVFLETS
jgi:signal transduction histidine kinase